MSAPEYLIIDSLGLEDILVELPNDSAVDCNSFGMDSDDNAHEHLNYEIIPDPNDTVFDAEEMELNYVKRTDAVPITSCPVSSVNEQQESNSFENCTFSDGASESLSQLQQTDNVLSNGTETRNLSHKKDSGSRKRRAFPAVATSDEWMKMYQTEVNEKQQQEDLKRKRIEERHSKQIQKEQEKLRKIEERQMKQRVKMEEIKKKQSFVKKNDGSKGKAKRQ